MGKRIAKPLFFHAARAATIPPGTLGVGFALAFHWLATRFSPALTGFRRTRRDDRSTAPEMLTCQPKSRKLKDVSAIHLQQHGGKATMPPYL
jgi:hypothetical protein